MSFVSHKQNRALRGGKHHRIPLTKSQSSGIHPLPRCCMKPIKRSVRMKKHTNMQQNSKGSNGKMHRIFHVEASFCQSSYVSGLRRLTTEGAVINGERFSGLLAKLSLGKSKVERHGKINICGGQEGSVDACQEVSPPVQGASSSMFDDWPNRPIGKHSDSSKDAVSKHEIASAAEEDALWNDLVELESADEEHPTMAIELDATVARQEDQESGLSSFEETEGHKSSSEDEKNGGDDDEFKRIWEDAEFVFACVKQSQNDKEGSELQKEEVECDHYFDFVYSVGNVCRLCQLISDDVIENFSFTTPSLKRRKRQEDADEAAREDARALANLSSTILAAAAEGGKESGATPLWIDPSTRSRMHGHQQEGFDFLQRNLARRDPGGCILAHAPGTGKTFLVITFLQSFLSSFPETRPLIVAPNSMLSVWEGEFRKWGIGDIQVLNLLKISATDYRSRRIHQLSMLMQWESTRSSILLVSYMTFSRMVMGKVRNIGDSSSEEFSRLLCRVPGLLVMDEGHNARTKETELLKALSKVSTKRRILLSGTLFQNSFTELYNMYRLVRPDFMAGYSEESMTQTTENGHRRTLMELRLFEKLGKEMMSEDGNVRWQAIRQIRLLSEPLVHYYKGQLLEGLPGLVDLILVMDLTGIQQRILDEQSIRKQQEEQQNSFFKKGNRRKSTKERESAMAEDKRLTKVCIHPACLVRKEGREDPEDSAKTMFVMRLVQLSAAVGEKVLVFSELLAPLDLLERMLGRAKGWRKGKEILRIEGETAMEERARIIERVNEDKGVKILLASIMTCGEGVSLVGTSRVVFLDVHWNPAKLRQAVSRAFRMGQKRKVVAYRLVAAPEFDKCIRVCKKEWMARQVFENVGTSSSSHSAFPHFLRHEPHPELLDPFFESPLLLHGVLDCFRLDTTLN